jgi:hypothetical protein
MRAAAAVLVAAAAVIWACGLVAAPVVAAGAPSPPAAWAAALAYSAGAVICHQQDARSLHVAGVRMPVCARCFGLYAGGAAGAALAAAWVCAARRALALRRARWRAAAVLAGVPTLAAWAGEHVAGLGVSGAARALLALPLGAAVAVIATLWAGGSTFEDTPAGSRLD